MEEILRIFLKKYNVLSCLKYVIFVTLLFTIIL